MPQTRSSQQSRFNEIQMLQQQIMFKQMQDLQRQKKLQELIDAKQHNLENQQSEIHSKQAPVAQNSPFINGTPVRDASQMFMFGNTNLVQGFPNGLVYSQAQNHVLHSMGLASQQLDVTPISSTGHSFSQYSHFHGASQESARVLTKPNNEHAENVSKSLMNYQFNVPSNQDINLFGPVFTQGLDMEGQTANIQQVNDDQRNASAQEFGGGQEQGGRHGHFSEITANINPSQGLATLDPLEQKILFELDDNSFGASLGEHGNMGTGGFEYIFENADHFSVFPSVQSGSWSALMQSAVAEASSSDTGLQEEWSGLSFQNPELSNDNQPSNFVESGKHATLWLDNNLQNASSTSPKTELLNTSNASLGCFQHYPATQFQFPKNENMRSDSSHEPNHQSSKEADERLNCSAQQKGTLEGSAPVQRLQCSAAGFPAPYPAAQTSHNMLELLHKVDRSREYRPGTESGYTVSVPTTDLPKAKPADAFSPSYNNSSASQYFGLRLAPPTQWPPVNYFDSSQISQQAGHSNNVLQVAQSDSNLLHNQDFLTKHSPQATWSYKGSRYPAFSPDASQETSHLVPVKNKDGQQSSTFETGHSLTTLGMAQQIAFSRKPPNVWVDVPARQNSSGMGSRKAISDSPSTSDAADSRMESAFEPGAHVLNSQGFDYGRGQTSKIHFGDESLSGHREANASSSSLVHGSNRVYHSGSQTPSTSTRDLEAFESSLKQTHVAPPNCSLLNPMHSDPITRVVMNNERADSDINFPQVTSMSQLNSASANHKDLPISSAARRDQLVRSSSQPLQDNSQDTVTYNKDGFHSQPTSNDMAANLIERSQINFPMAPSWFKNKGDANSAEHQLSVGRTPQSLLRNSSLVQVNLVGCAQYGSVWPATGTNSVAQLSSPYLQHLDVPNQNLVVLKSKKRKFPTFELLPWHKEATEGSSRPLDTSIAELEWAQAANQLPEKLTEEAEVSGDSLRMAHPKKRLILTTQLMQLLFRPAPAVVLSDDATTHYNTVTYFAARLALGDGCSLAIHSHIPHDSLAGKSIITKSIRDQDLSKVVENFIDRSKRLEDELLRLENRGSFLDRRVEFEELEKFSVINRFAKFHSRAQLVAAETASSVPKLYPQRYVTASPMPRTVPEGQHCLSL